MIIHKLNNGRLGNQLFQISAALAHAEKMGTTAQFPKWEYNKYFLTGIDDKLDQTFDCRFNNIFHNPHYGFDFHYTPIPEEKNLILHGFYHTQKYFENYKELIIKAFTPKNEFMQLVREAGKDFLYLQNTLAIHIRRGDYIGNESAHPNLSETEYCTTAMSMLEFLIDFKHPNHLQTNKSMNYIVFSDDIAWCKNRFNSFENFYFVEGNSDIVDLFLMAKCKHHIIANSSFSWWAAWLAKNMFKTDGITIAPKTWFGIDLAHYNTNDIYLPEWIKI